MCGFPFEHCASAFRLLFSADAEVQAQTSRKGKQLFKPKRKGGVPPLPMGHHPVRLRPVDADPASAVAVPFLVPVALCDL